MEEEDTMTAEYLAEKFASAMEYERYVATGTEEQRRRWGQVYESCHLTDSQRQLVSSFGREMKVLIVSGIWCGDCVQQCPLIQRIAEINPAKVQLRLLDRDQHSDLRDQVKINAGHRVPVVLLLSEDHELCAVAGDRTLSRYRALARKHLGAACPLAIAPPPADELAATLQDWVDEVERVQLMLRLSPRLRQKYGD
jgi:thiol-disulfide isomerase/thioredoxin